MTIIETHNSAPEGVTQTIMTETRTLLRFVYTIKSTERGPTYDYCSKKKCLLDPNCQLVP